MSSPADTAIADRYFTEAETLDRYRRWGYLQARLDPLGRLEPRPYPELDGMQGPAAEQARHWYCGSIGAEFMHIPDLARRRWVQERMETEPPTVNQRLVLERLVRAEIFEQTLQQRYLGSKRFSLEGVTGLIVALDIGGLEVAQHGAEQVVLAMSHRGRLNVMAHIVGVPLPAVFAGFEDVDPRSVFGSGDVKYHLGATGYHPLDRDKKVRIHLVSNPSHLEAVYPVALGRVRAKQMRYEDEGWTRVLPIVLHGDAAFAGQGILAEGLNLAELEGFEVGGTIHVIVNNLIGFTTEPEELHSSRFASDVARRLPIPIFHVNGEDLSAVIRVARMAVDFRYQFGTDVIVDLIGYRRHGHSEVDDPTITQPLLYKAIAEHPPLWQIFADAEGIPQEQTEALVHQVKDELSAAQAEAETMDKKPSLFSTPKYWDPFVGGAYKFEYEVETGVPAEELAALGERLTAVPDGFHVHPKIAKLLEQRLQMARGEQRVDFGMAEALAMASLVKAGVPVRLTGQDSVRGTFSHRHSKLIDIETEEIHFPLAHIADRQASVEIYNSMLSEAAVMGFEYGYSRDMPEALVMWEAQFGDFVNGAQIIIDQFVTAAEDKWKLLSGLVLLLPHGYEGQGPEHSSARLERFLQLAAEENIQVCQPSTAGQYFHLLRRQALRKWRKPLVVMTPKSMLRHPAATSEVAELTQPIFATVLGDASVERPRRLLLCSGKIRHELMAERKKQRAEATAIVAIEQLYPFPKRELAEELRRLNDSAGEGGLQEIVWVQEEPANMGALFFVLPLLRQLAGTTPVRTVKRAASSSPATGSAKAHGIEQQALLTTALSAPE
jgi:2-oxoglutarate dehydrogenase E1 component